MDRRAFVTAAALLPLAARAADAVPRFVPAARVAHAGGAMLLGAASAGTRLVAVGDHGIVLLSDDAGRQWRQATQVPVDVLLTGVSFADAEHGWAVGHRGVVLATQDGGETWTLQRSATEDRPLFGVLMADVRHGVAVGLWSQVLVTDDGGAHWTSVALAPPDGSKKADLNLWSVFADADGTLYAPAERGMLLRSGDGGRHWSYLATGYAGSLWCGAALPGGVLVAAGLRGSFYRSADAGRSWARIHTGSTSSITALAARGNTLVGVGLDGLVLRSDDAGATLKTSVRPDRLSLTAALWRADGGPLLFSRQGVVADAAPPKS